MKALRWMLACLVWLLSGLVGLVGVVLCVTLILAPLGIPLLFVARRLFKLGGQLVVPRAVRHPIDTLQGAGSDAADTARKRGKKAGKDAGKAGKKAGKKARKKVGKDAGKAGKTARKRTRKTSKRVKRKLPIG
jgi:hypothetical protein